MDSPLIIAIDGPTASGKGTLARRVAEHFGLAYLDTGALYRVAAFLVLMRGGDAADSAIAEWAAKEVPATLIRDPTLIFSPQLRTEKVGGAASVMAAIPAVREALLAFQRAFACHPPVPAKGAVLDGRDIGTVVCPDATVKLFIVASVESRAERRVKELRERGAAAIYNALSCRTQGNATPRATAGVRLRRSRPAPVRRDAIDTTVLLFDADQVFEQASDLIARHLTRR